MSYFKPVRRKLGVLMLLAACVFAAAWVRSYSVLDGLNFRVNDTTRYFFTSSIHGIAWQNANRFSPQNMTAFPAISFSSHGADTKLDFINDAMRDCRFGHLQFVGDASELHLVLIRHWTIVIPLTLLSAYLLLSRPRTPITAQSVDPEPIEAE